MSTDRLVDVRRLGLRQGSRDRVVDIDLVVEPGTVWGVVGPNGAGKTTLLRLLAGLLVPTSGEGTVLSRDLRRGGPGRGEALGYLPQVSAVQSDLTVRDLLYFRAALHGLPRAKTAADAKLESAGIAGMADQRLAGLSGGWVRRVELAAVLIHGPRLLLLDEPTTGLDPDARATIWTVITDQAAQGVGVIVNTHDLAEAELCGQLALMVDGRIVASGPPSQLLERAGATTLTSAWPILVRGR